jgi:hypothetical protein
VRTHDSTSRQRQKKTHDPQLPSGHLIFPREINDVTSTNAENMKQLRKINLCFLQQYTSLSLLINFIMTKCHDMTGRTLLYLGIQGQLGLWPTDDPLIDAQLWPLHGGEPLSLSFFKE